MRLAQLSQLKHGKELTFPTGLSVEETATDSAPCMNQLFSSFLRGVKPVWIYCEGDKPLRFALTSFSYQSVPPKLTAVRTRPGPTGELESGCYTVAMFDNYAYS